MSKNEINEKGRVVARLIVFTQGALKSLDFNSLGLCYHVLCEIQDKIKYADVNAHTISHWMAMQGYSKSELSLGVNGEFLSLIPFE